jgi:hypothetical protein
VAVYFDALMRDRFLPSGRVQYFPMSDYRGEGQVACGLSGRVRMINYRKVVDSTYIDTQVPSTRPPAYVIGEGVRLITPNELPKAAPEHDRYVIVGAGKTAMDVGVWLLEMGADPDSIRWIVPRDSWLINRETIQPGDEFYARRMGANAVNFEAASRATSMDDLFGRLEAGGQLLRIDRSVRPTMYRGATISTVEVESLRTIKNVVRKGRVLRLERERTVLRDGEVAATPDALYIDCTASAFGHAPAVPVFQGDRIVLQMIRANLTSFSWAAIAHVEAAYQDEAVKNALCPPIPPAETDRDWLRLVLADIELGSRWASEPALRRWAGAHRLAGFGGWPEGSPDAVTTPERIKAARPLAEQNLRRLLAGSGAGAALESVEA